MSEGLSCRTEDLSALSRADPAADRDCWLCGATIRADWPTLAPGKVPRRCPACWRWHAAAGSSRGESRRPFQFGLSTLLLIMTLFAVLCSIWRMAPGLGAVLTVATCLGLLGLTGGSTRGGSVAACRSPRSRR